jgi:cytochrome c553
MKIRTCSFLLALALAAGSALAQDKKVEGHPDDAHRNKTAMCIGCHGIPGYRTAFPEVYHVPKLGGQHAAYIVQALHEYRNGDRSHPSMRAIAGSLSDQDMANLAAYYGQAGGSNTNTASK